jgi:type I restriction enzyme R subunit
MCYNFEFLKKEEKYNSFTYACIEAEKSLVVSYASTAILSRRALELAVKWVFSYDEELDAPYQDNLATLIHDYRFKGIIDSKLFPMITYIQKLGNKAVHSATPITREQAVLSLRNLFEFVSWLDYCYSDEFHEVDFDESILGDNDKEKKTKQELKDLYERLGSKDRKLEEIIKENEALRRENAAKRQDNKKNREFKVDEISEFKTRKMYIDLEIELNGWTIRKDCIEEVEVTGMPNSTGVGYVDYVLFGDNGKPLALVEAKKTSVSPRIGQVQAQRYADCLEKQYGVRPIMFYTNGFEYYLWDDKSYPERLVSGIYTKEELEWLIFKRTNKASLKDPIINEDITDRHYQKMAINAVCDTLDKGNRKALLVMATGSGKTRTAISIVDVLIKRGWVKNALFLADRTALVKQAKKNFKKLLPELSLCNLLDSKDNPESRMVFSTYPTMMNAIDDVKNNRDEKLFTSGHFDLIIIDESHRSIYKKYQDIFSYFDAILLGLTATPKNDIDKNTYTIFELENNVPTYAYELGEAIEDKYLVPYHTIETKMKFMEEGIHYDDLSDEEKEQFEETFDDDVKDISGEALNSFLFNDNTIDMVLQELMEKGIKVEGGDKLGKTIIFAKNKRHADFIVKRFDILYPHYKGDFAKAVYTGINYVESTMDDFEIKDKLPQIAVSVDMLDTGIDIPEIVNLVFFKKIRSKVKFWQMIGRGTRLCEDLFGVGIDKESFRIFDYCGNFEFFRTNKNGKEAKVIKSLTENLFNIKISIIKELQSLDYQTDEYISHREALIEGIITEVSAIDETKFNSRMKIKYIHKFSQKSAYEDLKDIDVRELEEHVAPIIPAIDDDELAKRFDFLMYTIEYADLKGVAASRPKNKVVATAEKLAYKGSIEKVKKHEELIFKVQTNEHWEEADIFDHELVRIAFRDLIKFLDSQSEEIYYTNFTDEMLEVKETPGEYTVNDMQSYRKKVNQYLKEHKDDLVVFKLRNNKDLSEDDIKYLEKVLWQDLGTRDDYQKEFGEEPLLKLVSKIVGLDPMAANEAFSEFLSDESLNINQMEFVNLIVNYIIKNGSLDKRVLNEHPFNKRGNVTNLFEDKIDIAKKIINAIDKLNSRLSV